MKTYAIEVTITDTYKGTIEVQADNRDEAEAKVNNDLEACPLEERSNTDFNSDKEITHVSIS